MIYKLSFEQPINMGLIKHPSTFYGNSISEFLHTVSSTNNKLIKSKNTDIDTAETVKFYT